MRYYRRLHVQDVHVTTLQILSGARNTNIQELYLEEIPKNLSILLFRMRIGFACESSFLTFGLFCCCFFFFTSVHDCQGVQISNINVAQNASISICSCFEYYLCCYGLREVQVYYL